MSGTVQARSRSAKMSRKYRVPKRKWGQIRYRSRAGDSDLGRPPLARRRALRRRKEAENANAAATAMPRSEEHTSELQSRLHLVCRLLLEKKKKTQSVMRL